MEFRCPKCKMIITEHIENCKEIKYIECINPNCGYILLNPYYEEKRK